MSILKKILKYIGIVILAVYIVTVIIRIPHAFEVDRTKAEIEKIQSMKLTVNDVLGVNLPPDPGLNADKTIAGVDVNNNGIRDDVELAIFKKYPDSAKTRAPLLQYAMALQMEFNRKIVNTEVVTEVIGQQDRADFCIADSLVPRETPESYRSWEDLEKINNYGKFIKNIEINTNERKDFHSSFYKKLGSFGDLNENVYCDLNIKNLPN